MKLLRKYIRQLLKEDPMGFVHDLAASDKFGDQFFGGAVSKEAGREIKRAFANNADYQFLDSLNTVHWGTTYSLLELKGKGKDELSTTMTEPGNTFVPAAGLEVGLWVKGRITLAANDQDKLHSGFYSDYGAPHEGSEEEVAHRDASSGRNKRPMMSKDYSRYGQLQRGNEYHEEMARNTPYILDKSTWKGQDVSAWGQVNEALVDNWRPLGIVVRLPDVQNAISWSDDLQTAEDIKEHSAGVTKQIMLLALELGVPIFDLDQNELWSVGSGAVEEVRKYIRNLLIELRLSGEVPPDDLMGRFKAFMSEYDSMSKTNPLNPRLNYWYMGKKNGADCLVMTDLSEWDGAIHIGSIQTVPPDICEGQGFASQIMNKLIGLADKHSVPMSLDPKPFGSENLGVKELMQWYRRAGFSPNDDRGGEWWRDPK